MSVPVSANLHGGGRLRGLTPQELTYFEVTGNFYAVADPAVSGNVNSPIVQPVNALVTFTPRLPRGQQLFVSNFLVTPAYNAEQTINIIGGATGGTFTLSFRTDTTTPLAWDASPSAVQTALRALPSIGSGNCLVVADIEPNAYDVEFTGTLGDQPIPVISGNADLLTTARGSGFCEITVAATLLGSPEIVSDTAVSLPPLTAEIHDGVLGAIDLGHTPGIELTANTTVLGLAGDLIYDVTFSDTTFNGGNQYLAPFAFTAPTDDTPISLSSPSLEKLPYQRPSTANWIPPEGNMAARLISPGNWRQRATLRSVS